MQFTQIIGQNHIKNHLIQSVAQGRIPHAQLFIGPEGSGTLPMAIAYAQQIICNSSQSNTQACNLKVSNLSHPDLHFVYPVNTNDTVKKDAISDSFSKQWRSFITQQPYGSLSNWYAELDLKNKQGYISVEEAKNIMHKLSLKSFEGGYKVMIIWHADKLNNEASNKLLKLLEEPSKKTVFILIAESEQDLLPTITSRCQLINFTALKDIEIENALKNELHLPANQANIISKSAAGNYNKALSLANNQSIIPSFEKLFVQWVRAAFRAKGNAAVIHDLILWSEELSTIGREQQKQFLTYCIEMFRQALLINYHSKNLVYYQTSVDKFELEKFAPFVNGANITEIFDLLSDAIYHIERNGNAKMIFTDLSIKLTRLIHKK